jgi:hypothetical protein
MMDVATQGDDVKPEQLRQLADDLRKDLKSALGARRKVVDVVGPDTVLVIAGARPALLN